MKRWPTSKDDPEWPDEVCLIRWLRTKFFKTVKSRGFWFSFAFNRSEKGLRKPPGLCIKFTFGPLQFRLNEVDRYETPNMPIGHNPIVMAWFYRGSNSYFQQKPRRAGDVLIPVSIVHINRATVILVIPNDAAGPNTWELFTQTPVPVQQ